MEWILLGIIIAWLACGWLGSSIFKNYHVYTFATWEAFGERFARAMLINGPLWLIVAPIAVAVIDWINGKHRYPYQPKLYPPVSRSWFYGPNSNPNA